MRKEIKKKADLEAYLGKKLAKAVLSFGGGSRKKKPSAIEFLETKPKFYLNDGDTLHCYGVDLETSEITGERYCGSSDTAYMHREEQFGEGHTAPNNKALLFIQSYYNGRNMSWEVTLISSNLVRQLKGI